MLEDELQENVLELVGALGLIAYHTYDSRRSVEGFPDLAIVGGNGVLYRELKSAKGRVSPDQEFWLRALREAGQDADVWRPADWPNRITAELRTLTRVTVPRPVMTQAQLRKKLRGSGVSGARKFPSGQ